MAPAASARILAGETHDCPEYHLAPAIDTGVDARAFWILRSDRHGHLDRSYRRLFVRFVLAPEKRAYLGRNWLTALSLVIPAFRILRIASIAGRVGATATRSFRLVKVVGTMNRSMGALGSTLGRRGFAYVMLLTVAVLFAGAAGMYAFERHSGSLGFATFADAVWWTAMLLTTMGSGSWPESLEGRTLCVLLSLYAFAIFGYVTATIATYFIERDTRNEEGELEAAAGLRDIRDELKALRAELRKTRKLTWQKKGRAFALPFFSSLDSLQLLDRTRGCRRFHVEAVARRVSRVAQHAGRFPGSSPR